MGFKSCLAKVACICMGFKVVFLKTYANTNKSPNHILKTHSKSINKRAKHITCDYKSIKTHAYSSNYCSKRSRERTWILAPGRPSDKDNVLHAPAQLRLARTHGTHETKTKTKRSRSPGYGGRTSRTNSPKPPIYIHTHVNVIT